MSSLSDAFNAVVQACESPLVSYNMYNSYYPAYYEQKPDRSTIYSAYDFNTNTWTRACCCDCSSLMGWALFRGGYSQSFYACTTDTMWDYYMRQCGWQDMGAPSNNIWQPGDILQTRTTHTEMVYQGNGGSAGITMGAHGRSGSYSPEDNPGSDRATLLQSQVSIQTGLNTYAFTKLWRDPNGGVITPTINAKWEQINNTSQKYYTANGNTMNDVTNAGFPTSEQLNNMIMITSWMHANTSASNAAIAGIIGNMIWESTVNPNCWQLTPGINYGGYGLVQFDPPDKYLFQSWTPSDYATNPETNGPGQMDVIKYGIEHTWDVPATSTTPPGEWAPSYGGYSYTYQQFYELTDPQEAASSFLWQYERAGAPQESIRRNNALWVYNNMSNWGNPGWTQNWTRPTGIQTFLLAGRYRKGYYR